MDENLQLSKTVHKIYAALPLHVDSHLLEHVDNLWFLGSAVLMSEPCWYIFRGGSFMTNEE